MFVYLSTGHGKFLIFECLYIADEYSAKSIQFQQGYPGSFCGPRVMPRWPPLSPFYPPVYNSCLLLIVLGPSRIPLKWIRLSFLVNNGL